MANIQNNKNKGFILVSTIWLLAALTIIASAFAIWVERSLELVNQQSVQTQNLLDRISTKSTLLYLMSTSNINNAGWIISSVKEDEKSSSSMPDFDPMAYNAPPITGRELKIDNTMYSGYQSAIFSLQDEASFININNPNGHLLHEYLLAQGINERQKDALIDKLHDYIDEDDFNRIQGAESYHYKKLSLPPPTNRKLKTQYELVNVLGWRELIKNDRNYLDPFTVTQGSLLNINSASHSIMKTLSTVGSLGAKKIIQARNQTAFTSLQNAEIRTELPLRALFNSLRTSPSGFYRVSIWQKNSRLADQFSIELKPTSRSGIPWKINSSYALATPLRDDDQEPIKPQTTLFDSTVFTAEE